jgi:Cdc25 family phosphatase
MLKILKAANKKNTKTIVFHCMESQVRGPKCAIKFKFFLDFTKESNDWHIFVLEGGFDQWVRKYYNNPNLVENFDIEYWPSV